MNREEQLEAAAERIRTYRDCPLGYHRNDAVPGKGPANARVMLITEGSGKNEDLGTG